MKKLLSVLLIAVLACAGAVCAAETFYDQSNPPSINFNFEKSETDEPVDVLDDVVVVAYTVDFKNPTLSIVQHNYAYVWNPVTLKYDQAKKTPVYHMSIANNGEIAEITNCSNVGLRIDVKFTTEFANVFEKFYANLEFTPSLDLPAVSGTTTSSGTLSINVDKLKAAMSSEELGFIYNKEKSAADLNLGTFKLVVTIVYGD